MLYLTTTPTLPSNLAVCVGQDINYVAVKNREDDNTFYWPKQD